MKTIFKGLLGSQAYGTSTPESDYDYKSIHVQPIREILGFDYQPQIDFTKDDVSYEVRRYLELAQSANPTVLELMFLESNKTIVTSREFELIRSNRYKFLTKKCQWSFSGYAVDQIKKAKGTDKKMNWEDERKVRKEPIDFCFISTGTGKSMNLVEWINSTLDIQKEDTLGLIDIPNMPQMYSLVMSHNPNIVLRGISTKNGNTVVTSSLPKDWIKEGVLPLGNVHFNLNSYQIHCKEYQQYETWLKERNTARYVDVNDHGQRIDGKNMAHCVRLIDVATEIATEGELHVLRKNADILKQIRRGEMSLQSIIDMCEDKILGLNELYINSTLPSKIEPDLCKDILGEIREMQIKNEYNRSNS